MRSSLVDTVDPRSSGVMVRYRPEVVASRKAPVADVGQSSDPSGTRGGTGAVEGFSAAVRRPPDGLLRALSVATLLFVLLQLAVGLRMTDRFYPVTGYPMFSHGSDGTYDLFDLEGTASDGDRVVIEPEELGLTQLQLYSHLIPQVVAVDDQRASARLGAIASVYEERKDRTLDELTLWHREERADGPSQPSEQVATWTR